MVIKFEKISDFATCPSRNTSTDAGYDLYSTEFCSINPLSRRLVSTGIKIEIPEGYYGRIAPRSGLAVNKGLDVMAGVIDSGYRGELKVLLVNLNPLTNSNLPHESIFGSSSKIDIKQGDRIGMIRFGSRVDLYFNNRKIMVKIGQNVIAGESLIARL